MKVAQSKKLFRGFFEEAGYQLARHIIAIQPKISKVIIIKINHIIFLLITKPKRSSLIVLADFQSSAMAVCSRVGI